MKIIVSDFMSLDGVVQAPGGAEEDTDALHPTRTATTVRVRGGGLAAGILAARVGCVEVRPVREFDVG